MKAAEETDDVLTSGVVAGELQRTLHCFRARVTIVNAVGTGHGSDRRESFRKRRHLLVIKVGAGHVNEPGALVLNGLYHFGMTVAGGVDRNAGREVQERVAVYIFDPGASTALHGQGIAAGIAGRDKTLIFRNHLPGQWTRKSGDEPWAEPGAVRGFFGIDGRRGDHGEALLRRRRLEHAFAEKKSSTPAS